MEAEDMDAHDQRTDRESAFFDELQGSDARDKASKFYAVREAANKRHSTWVEANAHGVVLDYGCGTGTGALRMALTAEHVTGIDISPARIAEAQERARTADLKNVDFRVMDAEHLEFPAETFDAIIGNSILHHLHLDEAFSEMRRILRPGGTSIFLEPLGHNPAINWYRSRTPQMRTVDEHPLLMEDLRLADKYFEEVEVEFFDLFTLLSVPLRRTPLFGPALGLARLTDRLAFSLIPPARMLAWTAVFLLRKRRTSPDAVR